MPDIKYNTLHNLLDYSLQLYELKWRSEAKTQSITSVCHRPCKDSTQRHRLSKESLPDFEEIITVASFTKIK